MRSALGIAELFDAFIAGLDPIRMVRDAPDDHAVAGLGEAVMDAQLTRLIQFADTPEAGARRDLRLVIQAAQDELHMLTAAVYLRRPCHVIGASPARIGCPIVPRSVIDRGRWR